MFNLLHHKTDFELEAWWIFTATGHDKSTARRTTLKKNILLSDAKDFFKFSQNQQLETAKKSNRNNPAVEVFFLGANEIEEIKANILDFRIENLQALRKKKFLIYFPQCCVFR